MSSNPNHPFSDAPVIEPSSETKSPIQAYISYVAGKSAKSFSTYEQLVKSFDPDVVDFGFFIKAAKGHVLDKNLGDTDDSSRVRLNKAALVPLQVLCQIKSKMNTSPKFYSNYITDTRNQGFVVIDELAKRAVWRGTFSELKEKTPANLVNYQLQVSLICYEFFSKKLVLLSSDRAIKAMCKAWHAALVAQSAVPEKVKVPTAFQLNQSVGFVFDNEYNYVYKPDSIIEPEYAVAKNSKDFPKGVYSEPALKCHATSEASLLEICDKESGELYADKIVAWVTSEVGKYIDAVVLQKEAAGTVQTNVGGPLPESIANF